MIRRRSIGHVTLALSVAMLALPAAVIVVRQMQPVEYAQLPATMDQQAPEWVTAQDGEFSGESVDALAARLAAAPHRLPTGITPGLEKLGYDQYRDMRSPAEQALWRDEATHFRLDMLPAGSIYTQPVRIFIVDDGAVDEIEPRAGMFELAPRFPQELRDKPLSISGFRVRARLNNAYWDEFLVFQGASYFRALGRGQNYGLSARGLALRTGEPEGEEFPAFTQFWIEKPGRSERTLTIHALLESPSVTGAYHFEVVPGRETRMNVRYTLFPRVDLRTVGIAPLTSMFLFDASNRARFDDFRHRAHDSDGLLFESRGGEQVWRHLGNPGTLQLSAFTNERPRAFGLAQRARRFEEFQDLEANYERRPTAWVEFPEAAAPGPLRLVEIPTRTEANDNIVAFWQPAQTLPAGQPYSGTYRLTWTAESLLEHDAGRFVSTRIGANMRGDRRLVVLDLEGAGDSPENLDLEVSASAGKVFHPMIQANPAIRGLRATFEFDSAGAGMIEFRAVARKGERPVSETWLYRWTAG